jgi:hypothetical protein
MGLKFGFIGAKAARLCGKKYDKEHQSETIQLCRQGVLDAAVVSVKSGKNGCNLQGMSWMVSLGYISQATEEEQAKGIVIVLFLNLTGQGDAVELVSSSPPDFMCFGLRVRHMIRSLGMPTNCA